MNKIFCLIGPSGTGKTKIANKIPLNQVISYRTRAPREGEVDGVAGHFIDKKTFLEMDKQNLWIAKTDYANNYYGITQGELLPLEDGPMSYVIDWPGVITLKKALNEIEGCNEKQVVTIFINTSRYDLEARLTKAKRDPDEIKVRLDRSDRDYATSYKCDYIVDNENGRLVETINQIMNIIFEESFK